MVPPGTITNKMKSTNRNVEIDELSAEILTQDLEQIRKLFVAMDGHLRQLSALVQNQPVIDEHICKLGNSVEGLKKIIGGLTSSLETRLSSLEAEIKTSGAKQDRVLRLVEILLQNQNLNLPPVNVPEEENLKEELFTESEATTVAAATVQPETYTAEPLQNTSPTQKLLEKISKLFPQLSALGLEAVERNTDNNFGWQAGDFWLVMLPPAKENGEYDHNQFHKGVFPELQSLRRNSDIVAIIYDGNINKRTGVEKEAADRKFILTQPEELIDRLKEKISPEAPTADSGTDVMTIVKV